MIYPGLKDKLFVQTWTTILANGNRVSDVFKL